MKNDTQGGLTPAEQVPGAVRALDLNSLTLLKGSHPNPGAGMCVMEAVAFIAGEPHSDSPECASPVIASMLRTWNDGASDEERQALKPYIPRLIGTRGSAALEERRGWLAVDWIIRTHAPTWLRVAGLHEAAATLESLGEINSETSLNAALPALSEAQRKSSAARAAAWDAAWAAARAAAWDAARDAARAAAWAAARDAAWAAAWAAAWDAAWAAAWAAARDAAWAAAWAAARDAARDAAWDAAWAAARAALDPTRKTLLASAHSLLVRMIELTDEVQL